MTRSSFNLTLALAVLFGSSLSQADTRRARRPGTRERELRVCAEPANLPYSNRAEQGFENELASFVARAMHARLRYTWSALRRGLVRNTLQTGACDVILGVPVGLDRVLTTRPYYRSTFVFVSRQDRGLASLRSIDDERLKALRIGVPLAGDDGANPAPVLALSRRGIVSNLTGFSLWVHDEGKLPPPVRSIVNGDTDVAILWGPLAGPAATNSPVPLRVQRLREEQDAGTPFAFSIAMGVRLTDVALAHELDTLILRNERALTAILRKAGVPLLELAPAREAAHGAR